MILVSYRISKKRIRLLEPFRPKGFDITVPKGFVTDGASIPKIFWWTGWHPFDNDTLVPAIIHDYLYRKQKLWRCSCDNIFFKLMTKNKVNPIKKWIYYIAVRLFGSFKAL